MVAFLTSAAGCILLLPARDKISPQDSSNLPGLHDNNEDEIGIEEEYDSKHVVALPKQDEEQNNRDNVGEHECRIERDREPKLLGEKSCYPEK